MLQLNQRQSSRIFILVFAAVIAFSNVSKCIYLEDATLADDVNEATNFREDQDADIFIAEIFPEGAENFEQIFRPLTRYKKAVLGLDAQIEPMSNSHMQKHDVLATDDFAVDADDIPTLIPTANLEQDSRGRSDAIRAYSSYIPQVGERIEDRVPESYGEKRANAVVTNSRTFLDMQTRQKITNTTAREDLGKSVNTKLATIIEHRDKIIKSTALQPTNKLVEIRRTPAETFTSIHDEDLPAQSSGSGEKEGSGSDVSDSTEPWMSDDTADDTAETTNENSTNGNDKISNWGSTKEDSESNDAGSASSNTTLQEINGTTLTENNQSFTETNKTIHTSNETQDANAATNTTNQQDIEFNISSEEYFNSGRSRFNNSLDKGQNVNLTGYSSTNMNGSNAENMEQYEEGNKQGIYTSINKGRFHLNENRFTQHEDVNEQPINTDKGSGELNNISMYTDNESGDGVPEEDIQMKISERKVTKFATQDKNNRLLYQKQLNDGNFSMQDLGNASGISANENNMTYATTDSKVQTNISRQLSVAQQNASQIQNLNSLGSSDLMVVKNKSHFLANKSTPQSGRPIQDMAIKGIFRNASLSKADEITAIGSNSIIKASVLNNSNNREKNQSNIGKDDNTSDEGQIIPNHRYVMEHNSSASADSPVSWNKNTVQIDNKRNNFKPNLTESVAGNEKPDEKGPKSSNFSSKSEKYNSYMTDLKNVDRTKLSPGEAARKIFLSSLNSHQKDEERNSEENVSGKAMQNKGNSNKKSTDDKKDELENEENLTDQGSNWSSNQIVMEENDGENKAERKDFERGSKAGNESSNRKHGKKSSSKARHKSIHKRKKKNYHKGRRSRNHGRTFKHKTKKFKVRKSDLDFITLMMSLKARELYRNLIHDTSKALMARKFHQSKRHRHHFMPRKLGQFPDDEITGKSIDKHQMHYLTPKKHKVAKVQLHDLRKLTTRLLNTMTKNDQNLLKESKFFTKSPITAERKNLTPEKLDSPNSLIEKLAELKFTDKERIKEKEVPIPEAENAEDTSLNAPEVQNENPGKTVLQKQGKVGLDRNINMDSLDGSKQEYEVKSLDAKIEGELAKNKKEKEISVENLVSTQVGNGLKNITESTMKVTPMPLTLNVYNAEESLGNEPEQNESAKNESLSEIIDETGAIVENNVEQALELGENVIEQFEANRVENGTKTNLAEKKWQRRPTMYFAGNSSLWKHHPYVSMDIKPLVDVFYKVNHKNLINLVKEEEGGEEVGSKEHHGSIAGKQRKNERNAHKKSTRKDKGAKRGKKSKERYDVEVDAYMEQKHDNKKITTFSVKNGESRNHRKALYNSRIQHEDKKHSAKQKYEKSKPKQKYKHKHKKHVKGTAKFGIGEAEKKTSPPEIPEFRNNMPDNVKYYKIEKAAKHGAVCIDGSIPGYYFRQGEGSETNKWIIHLHGGAWCYDPETCFRRSHSILGSTKNWSAENITNFFQGILSKNRIINPWFSDWNVVVQSYCDGGLFSGRRKEPLVYRGRKLYFRGRQILKAMVESLKRRNIANASDIVLSGTSAGGLAVLLQGDYLRHKLPKTAAVRGLVDAGFFLDSETEGGPKVIGNQFRGLYSLQNPKLRKKCESGRENSTRYQCLFPQYTVEHTKLPIFFVNALYDHWQLSELQKLPCIYHNDFCVAEERDRILDFRKIMYSRLNDALARLPRAGLFADSCIGHGQVIVDYTWSRIRVNNSTVRDAFTDWLRDEHGAKRHINVDCHFPCNGSCPKSMVNSCIKNFKGASNNHRTKRNSELC